MDRSCRYGRFLLPSNTAVFARIDASTIHVLHTAPWLDTAESGQSLPISCAQCLCPVVPSKILCIGKNYLAHAKEMGGEVPPSPLLFLKPPSALLAPNGTIQLPQESCRVEHEAELGVVIGKTARRIPVETALDYVLGYTIVADITARDLQKSDGQWSRAKGFDTFCPVGPSILTNLDPASLDIACRVNGETRQQGHTRNMIFPVAQLVAHLSQAMTLEPGDLIATGTPEGVGPIVDGDDLEIEIQPIGVLRARVRNESHEPRSHDPLRKVLPPQHFPDR